MLRLFRRFLAHRRGNVAIIVALSIIPMFMAAGLAIDFVRKIRAESALQAAVDAAVLAAAAKPDMTNAQVEDVVQDYLNVNSSRLGLTAAGGTLTVDATTRTITYEATATLPTTLMKIVNINELNIAAESQARRSRPGPVELVLAIDQTFSMGQVFNAATGQTKRAALIETAGDFATSLLSPQNPGARMALVPFTSYVNLFLGASAYPAWTSQRMRPRCTYSNCTTQPCTIDDVATTCQVNCQTTTCTDQQTGGCMGHRPYETTPPAPDNPLAPGDASARIWPVRTDFMPSYVPEFPGVIADCATGMLPFTSVATTVRNRLSHLILVRQETYLGTGLIWSWNMLDPDWLYPTPPSTNWPATGKARSTAEIEDMGGQRVAVLVTDGANSAFPSLSNTGEVTPLRNATPPADRHPDALTRRICSLMREDGIEIYTLFIGTPNTATQNLLIDCSGDAGRSFEVSTSAQLEDAFTSISNQLQEVKLMR